MNIIYSEDMYEPYDICDDCEVKDYCRDIDKEYRYEEEWRCIHHDIDSCFYRWDKEIDDLVELSDEESKILIDKYNETLKRRIIDFKKKRNYKKK